MKHINMRPVSLVILALLAASLACSLVTEDTVTDDKRLVREERPALIVLAPVNGSVYATGTEIGFHVLAYDLGIGVSRVEVQIDLVGEELLLEHTAPEPTQNLEVVIPWTAITTVAEQETYLVTVRAFRPNGDPGDNADDIPSNEVVLSLKVVPPPGFNGDNLPDTNTTTTPASQLPDTLTTFPGSVVGALPAPVRQGPGTSYSLIQDLSAGTTVQVAGRSVDSVWLVIRLDNGYGWIFRDMVTLSTDINSLPVVQAPPQ